MSANEDNWGVFKCRIDESGKVIGDSCVNIANADSQLSEPTAAGDLASDVTSLPPTMFDPVVIAPSLETLTPTTAINPGPSNMWTNTPSSADSMRLILVLVTVIQGYKAVAGKVAALMKTPAVRLTNAHEMLNTAKAQLTSLDDRLAGIPEEEIRQRAREMAERLSAQHEQGGVLETIDALNKRRIALVDIIDVLEKTLSAYGWTDLVWPNARMVKWSEDMKSLETQIMRMMSSLYNTTDAYSAAARDIRKEIKAFTSGPEAFSEVDKSEFERNRKYIILEEYAKSFQPNPDIDVE